MLLVGYGLLFGAIVLGTLASYQPVLVGINAYVTKRVEEMRLQLEDMFVDLPERRLRVLYFVAPPVIGLAGWISSQSWVAAIVGGLIGLVVPRLIITRVRALRTKQFHAQFVDALLMMSSSLRACLTLVQTFTVVVEEMPPPISQEFGLMLKEIRMGVSLDEAIVHFRERAASDDMNLFVTTVLVARETGGDITTVFSRLVDTMRERKKIRERIKTLTFTARMQAAVMALLPFVFCFIVYSINPNHFRFFLTDPTGKVMLVGVALTQVVVCFLFMRFSRSPL